MVSCHTCFCFCLHSQHLESTCIAVWASVLPVPAPPHPAEHHSVAGTPILPAHPPGIDTRSPPNSYPLKQCLEEPPPESPGTSITVSLGCIPRSGVLACRVYGSFIWPSEPDCLLARLCRATLPPAEWQAPKPGQQLA